MPYERSQKKSLCYMPVRYQARRTRSVHANISRYAAHLGARNVKEDPTASYNILQNMDVYTSVGISKSLSINQHGGSVTIPQHTAYFHLAMDGSKLNLYVPKSKQRRQVCLNRQLPMMLLRHLGVKNSASGRELGSIITASSLFVVDELLQDAGIIELNGIERPEDDSAYESSSSEGEDNPDSLLQTPPSHQRTESISPDVLSRPTSNDDPFQTPATSVFSESPCPPERLGLYKQLLDAVIRHARNIPTLPHAEETTMASTSINWDFNTSLAVGSLIPNEKEIKIGAAGELFVSGTLNISVDVHVILIICRLINYWRISSFQALAFITGKAQSETESRCTISTRASLDSMATKPQTLSITIPRGL